MGSIISGWDLSFGMGLNFQKFRDGMQKFPGFSGWDGMGSGWDLTLLEINNRNGSFKKIISYLKKFSQFFLK